MSARLTVLGSGTMMPTKRRNPSAILVRAGRARLLLDCGHGTLRRMVDFGIDPQSIDAVFISHFHADHFGDVFHLIHARFVHDLYYGLSQRPLTIFGPENLQRHFAAWRRICWPEAHEQYSVKFFEGPRETSFLKMHFEIFRIHHVPWFQSVGIRLQIGKKSLLYTGDTGSAHPPKDLIRRARGADLFITEAGGFRPTPNHYSLQEAIFVAKQARVKKTLFTHFRPHTEARIKKLLRGKPDFLCAADGFTLSI